MDKRIEPKGTRTRGSKKVDVEMLRRDVKENPELYQYERAKKFKVSQSTMWQELKRIGVTYKKNVEPSESGRNKTYVIPKENRKV